MGAPWEIKIYGASTDVAGDMPAKTTVEAISGVQVMTINCGWVRPKPVFEDSTIEFLDGTKQSPWRVRITYTPEMEIKYFPTTDTPIETFYSTSVLNKKYKWCWFNNFPLRPLDGAAVIAATKVKAVAITGISIEDSPGYKRITFNMENRSRS
jgi:hypothetical protein